jgi:hypothetical protein
VRRFYLAGFGLWLCVWLAGSLAAETFQLLDGTTLTGEIIPPAKDDGLNIKIAPGKYQRLAWTNLSQTTLQELAKNPNPEIVKYAEPLIEITEEQKLKKTEVVIKENYPRLTRPEKGSLVGALFGSSIGLVSLLLLYAANIYAGYQIATVRAFPPVMVCGAAAVAPVIGPIVFLCLPTRVKSAAAETREETSADAAFAEAVATSHASMADAPADAAPSSLHLAQPPPAASPPALPEAQVFKRGQFTFNRRFIETKFSGFFGIVRRDPDKDMILLIKSTRGEFPASRITRIAANDMHIEVRKGTATNEVPIAFVEIQEIQLKHKDA